MKHYNFSKLVDLSSLKKYSFLAISKQKKGGRSMENKKHVKNRRLFLKVVMS